MDSVNFELTYAALKMFGKQLYSNVGSAISELVANGIDAKADDVYISINIIDKNNATVEIFDNGNGMSPEDIKEHYIKIGYNKRTKQTSEKNTLLGRKGIGKLAALYLSDCFTIATKKVNSNPTVWYLDVSDTQDDQNPQLTQKDIEIPSNLTCYSNWEKSSKGTLIFLQNVNFERMGDRAFESLESKLSNFFLYDAMSAKIWINIFSTLDEKGKFKLVEKRIAFKNMSFIFAENAESFNYLINSTFKVSFTDKLGNERIHEEKTVIEPFKALLDEKDIEGEYKGVPYKLKGWVGIHSSIDKDTAEKNDPKYIKNQFYNPNQLRVYVRNKMGMANMIEHLGIARAFANYIEGEIAFDILDDDDLDDIATAGRQDFDTQDERFIKLKDMMLKIGNALVGQRQALADRIKEAKDKQNNQISTNAKKIFTKEVHDEIEAITDFTPESKRELENIIVNKIEGDVKVEPKAKYTIFLSHASKDKMISDCIYNYLKHFGFNGDLTSHNCEIFYSSSGLDTDSLEPLSKVIRDAIISKNNDILFLTSKNFNKSPFCLFEGGAAWATRSIGEYKVLSLSYDDIPTFLTNGKSEVSLGIKSVEDFSLDGIKYNQMVTVINRLINHLNKNREAIGATKALTLNTVSFPDKVELKNTGKTEKDFMDSLLYEYWNTYVVENAAQYIKDNNA